MGIEFTQSGKIMLVVISIIVLFGAWLLASGFLPLARRKAKKTVRQYHTAGRVRKKNGVNDLDDAMQALSKRFVKYIHLNPIARSEKEKALKISNMAYTPEEYIAYMLTVSSMFGIAGLLFFAVGMISDILVLKIIGIGLIAMGVISYVLNNANLKKNQKKAVGGLEFELTRFVSFINLNLALNNESILSMLERYTADNEAFGSELAITLADAKTSNFDGAMARFDQRINSDRLKPVIRGLISANMGDDVTAYFAILEKEMSEYEITYLRQNIQTIPSRMRIPKILMYLAMAMSMFFPLIMQIVESFISVFAS